MEIILKGDVMSQSSQFPDFQGKILRSANKFIVFGWIFAIISLFFFPAFFGLLGIVMGIIANKRGHRGGTTVIVATMLMMAIGILAGTILSSFLKMFLGVFLISNL